MKNKKKTLFILLASFCTIVFVLPLIAFCIINWGILPSHKLTPLVVNEVNKRIDGQLACEKIELTFLSTYPHLGLRITNGNLLSHAMKDNPKDSVADNQPIDSLLHFSQTTLVLHPLDYLWEKKITIGEVCINNPYFYGYIREDGKANWDIYNDETEPSDTSDSSISLPTIDLQKVRIIEGHFIYDDRQANMYAEIEGFFLQSAGSLIDGGNTLAIETGSSSILFQSPDYTLKNSLALHLKSNIELTDHFHTVTLYGAEMKINNLPFTADGSVTNLPDSKMIGINIEMGLKASDMNDLLSFIPDIYLQNRENILTNGAVTLDVNIMGELGENAIPTVNACCQVEKGSFFLKDVKQGIDNLELDMDLHIDGMEPALSSIKLEKLILEGLNTSLSIRGEANNLLLSPAVHASVKGQIDFTRLAEEFLNPDTLSLQGLIDTDLETSFLLTDLMDGRYNNVKIKGNLDIDTLIARSLPYDLDMFVSHMHFAVDSSQTTSSYIAGNDLMKALFTVDSMQIRYKEEINTNLTRLHLTAKTSPTIDTTAVMPITSHIQIESIRTRLPDSVWVVAKNTYLRGGIKPSESDKQIPQLLAGITVDSLRYFDMPSHMGAMFANSSFSIEALPYRDAIRQRFQSRQSDSTRVLARRDTTGRQIRAAGRTNRTNTNDTATPSGEFLKNWEVRGSVSFNQMRLFSRLFPLPMHMEKTKVKFDTNNIQFSDALFHAGKSCFKLNGEINSIRRALLRGGKLQGKFSLSSDYIDCNQLMQAINKGMLYAESQLSQPESGKEEKQLEEIESNVLQDSITMQTDTTELLFVVPAFLDMALDINARKIDYKELNMENVTGEIVLRNQNINLRRLDMQSNIGNGNISMFYSSSQKNQAQVGFDMSMHNILVEKLIHLYPAIDSLLPMLRSFEGVVDCQMAATCDIDSTSSIILPSLHAGCYVHGKDMVLLDGETFTEISKTLMFKNKEKNRIDSISVDLAIKDNKIDIYPFLIEIDRYRVAVGGTHKLDMNFDYHVSVLKSPVPFKLGIDVTGNLDKPKYKITKCRYKDIFQPAKEKELEASRSNIRAELRDFIRQQILSNAPELALTAPEP
ncbi:hypothetical protein M2101_001984 [Parabacteroides sp. PM5-20]|uniref:AsmA-like C-terminal region-containing protein n=1 Tax=Parabacteroides sp. PM5-20 TaxID=2940527 RepID=UPI002476BACD|nr:AsmA-like C-terminal region-containing protein [Parabacteroides sp. PM5-20]MDH6535301.1 hypothetical protein [Parabacteroides sp. PM5-20]